MSIFGKLRIKVIGSLFFLLAIVVSVSAAATIQLEIDAEKPCVQTELTYISVNAAAIDGSSPGTHLTLNLPTDALAEFAVVDGLTVDLKNPLPIGDLINGGSHVVTWGVRFGTMGMNTYSIEAVSTDVSVPSVTVSNQKIVHKEGGLSHPMAVINLGDNTGAKLIAEAEAFGWVVQPFTLDQLSAGSLSASEYPVTVIYDYSSAGVRDELKALGVTEAVKAYMEAGGNILLLGTAGEFLDVAGITDNDFSYTT